MVFFISVNILYTLTDLRKNYITHKNVLIFKFSLDIIKFKARIAPYQVFNFSSQPCPAISAQSLHIIIFSQFAITEIISIKHPQVLKYSLHSKVRNCPSPLEESGIMPSKQL